MSRYDITRTNAAVERLIETTENPRHLYLLHAYNRHRYLEMAGRYEEIFAPDMTVAEPVYHFTMMGERLTLEGAEAVKSVYAEWTATDQCIFYVESEKLAVSDDMIVSTSIMLQQTPGKVLAASGLEVDPEATYLVKSAEHMIWPYQDGLLVGEDVWEYDETQRDVIALDPSEVLTAERSGQLRPADQAAASGQPVPELIAVQAVRTPSARFADLPDYPFGENYAEVGDGVCTTSTRDRGRDESRKHSRARLEPARRSRADGSDDRGVVVGDSFDGFIEVNKPVLTGSNSKARAATPTWSTSSSRTLPT